MKRIIIYVSDHGYGHASRTVALVRNLLKRKNSEITIKNSSAYNFLKTSLPRTTIEKIITDVGPLYDWTKNKVDMDLTISNYLKFIKNEQSWISKESSSFKKKPADLIIADISPMALRLAEQVRCQALSISNFSWIDILEKLPAHQNKKNVLEWLKESFPLAEFAIKLPLSMKLHGYPRIKESGLLSRNLTSSRKNILQNFGMGTYPISSYLGEYKTKIFTKNRSTNVIELRGGNIFLNDKRIKNEFYEGQNIVAISQLVVTKIGYGIMSDCLKFRRPMILISRGNYPENESLRKEIEKFSIAKILDINDSREGIELPTGKEIKEMSNKINRKLIDELETREDPSKLVYDFLK